jgi:hypothetical protein
MQSGIFSYISTERLVLTDHRCVQDAAVGCGAAQHGHTV